MPVFKDGRPNPRAYGQVSAGSISGMWVFLGFVFGDVGPGGGKRGGDCGWTTGVFSRRGMGMETGIYG